MARSGGQYEIIDGEKVLVIPPTKDPKDNNQAPKKSGKSKSDKPRK